MANADLTGNGSLEFFLHSFGNTARSARIVGLDGCDLRTFGPHGLDESLEESFGILIGVGGNICAPIGCVARVSCTDGRLVAEITTPTDTFEPDRPLSEVEVRWTSTTYGYADGDLVPDDDTIRDYFADEPPSTAPRPGDADVIDCLP